MKLRTAFVAAALMAAGAGAVQAADETSTRQWIVGTRSASGSESAPGRNRVVHRFTAIDGYAAAMTDQEAEELRNSGRVRYVEPVRERRLLRAEPLLGPRAGGARQPAVATAISARSAQQVVPYGVDLVRARDLWKYGRGAGIKVAVVDTGIDYRHPELASIYKGGHDFIENDDDPIDDHGHGTHVAGTIAAADDAFGVVGIAPQIELYALKVLNASGKGGGSDDIVEAIGWALEHDIDILNLSLGGAESSIAEQEAFENALRAGLLAVAASGNDYEGIEGIGYPAAYPAVLSVGAIDSRELIASFSQRGTGLGLVGPGVGINSTFPVGTGSIADIAVDGEFLPEVEVPEGSPLGEFTGPFVNCGTGNLSEIPASVEGRIALIRRGGTSVTTPSGFTFNEKVRNAKTMGAAGVVIYNHENSSLTWTLIRQDLLGRPIVEALPLTVAISKSEGEAILAKTGSQISLAVSPYDFKVIGGTSMASPHVAGVAALVWSLAPSASAAQVREALVSSGRDLGPGGWDTTYGGGVVDAVRAARTLAPQVFGAPARARTTSR